MKTFRNDGDAIRHLASLGAAAPATTVRLARNSADGPEPVTLPGVHGDVIGWLGVNRKGHLEYRPA